MNLIGVIKMHTFLRLPDVMAATGLARSTIYHKIEHNDFPAPVKIGARAVGWFDDEISDWIEARRAARDSAK